MLKIELVGNGAVLRCVGESTVYVYNEESLKGLQEMLWKLCEIVSPCNGRYDKERIQIKIIHGDKYQCKDKGCEICRGDK